MDREKLTKIRHQPHLLGHYLGYNKLLPIHSDWIKYIWLDGADCVLQAHRNSYKTTSVIVVGCIWYLLFRPNATILILRKNDDKASEVIEAIAKHYKNGSMNVLIKQVLDFDFELKTYNKSKLMYPLRTTVSNEYSIEAYGIGSDITGSHYDRIIADDIITQKDRNSRAERERTKEYVRELINIKKVEGKRAFTGTPWHRDDAFNILPPADKYPLGAIDIPELTKDKIKEIRNSTTTSLFAANYFLKHIASEGRVFPDPTFEKWNKDLEPIAYLDPAYSGTHYTSLSMGVKEGEIIHIMGWIWRRDVTELYKVIKDLLNAYKCGTLYIESNADKGLSVKDMKKIYPSVQGRYEKENKHNKIISYVKKNFDRLRFAEDCQEDYVGQIVDYEEGQEPDDAPDSLAGLLREMDLSTVDINENSYSIVEYEETYGY